MTKHPVQLIFDCISRISIVFLMFFLNSEVMAQVADSSYLSRNDIYGKESKLRNWYLGAGYGLPMMSGDFMSVGGAHNYLGQQPNLKLGYRFSSIFGLEASLGLGHMRAYSPMSALNYRLGAKDAMTYYPFTILGGSDDYTLSRDDAGVWENHGNNLYIESNPYSSLYVNTKFFEGSIKAVFNLNRLFMDIPKDRDQRLTFILKPGIYLHKFYSQASFYENNKSAAPMQSPLSVGLGGDIAMQFALSERLGLEVGTGIIWVSQKNFDGVKTIKRSHDDFIVTPNVSLVWKFGRKVSRCCDRVLPVSRPAIVETVPVAKPAYSNPFIGGEFAFDTLSIAKEARKERTFTHTSYLHFEVSRWDIKPGLRNNREELRKIREAFNRLYKDDDIVIQSIDIDGFASPEGNHSFNVKLSRNRAKAIAEYIADRFAYPIGQINTEGHAEDWKGLADSLSVWDSPEREKALSIVSGNMSDSKKKAAMKELSGFRYLLDNVYPTLRRNTHTFHYSVIPYTVEHSREVIKSAPEKLSLGEIVEVINSYPMYSPGFNRSVNTALSMYPDEPVFRIYGAAMAMRNGYMNMASDYLSTLEGDSRAWNVIGVYETCRHNYEKALEYFRKAAASGSDSARSNLEKLENSSSQHN